MRCRWCHNPETLSACQSEGVHTAAESALFVKRSAVERVMPYMNLFFADCKLPVPEKHLRYTGREQEPILRNIRYLSSSGANVIFRIPVIPGINDSAEDMEGFAKIISTLGGGVREVELLRYNNLGASK